MLGTEKNNMDTLTPQSTGTVLAVLNDQIRPPNNIQNGRNKQTFGTYAFTINLVPLVLEETCFAGHTFEYK